MILLIRPWVNVRGEIENSPCFPAFTGVEELVTIFRLPVPEARADPVRGLGRSRRRQPVPAIL